MSKRIVEAKPQFLFSDFVRMFLMDEDMSLTFAREVNGVASTIKIEPIFSEDGHGLFASRITIEVEDAQGD